MSKTPNPIDVHVGRQLRTRRVIMGMSQGRLGERLGLTFQQVQKYEKGANRIGASRLYEISLVLGVSVVYFFENLPVDDMAMVAEIDEDWADGATKSADNVRLTRAFRAIDDAELRSRIVDLVSALARSRLKQ